MSMDRYELVELAGADNHVELEVDGTTVNLMTACDSNDEGVTLALTLDEAEELLRKLQNVVAVARMNAEA